MYGWFEGLTNNVLIAFSCVFVVLIIGTIIVRSLKKTRNYQELKLRVNSWWVIMLIFSFSILSSRNVALIFLAFVCFLAFKEYLSLIPTRNADHRVLFWAYLAIPFQFYLLHIGWYDLFTAFIPIYMFLILPIRMVLIGETKGFLVAISTIHWGLMTTVFCISHMGALLTLPETGNPVGGNAGLIFFIVVTTQMICFSTLGLLLTIKSP